MKIKPLVRAVAYDYREMIDAVQEMSTKDFDDYASRLTMFREWCDSKGYGATDPVGKPRSSSQIWFAEHQALINSGEIQERPFLCFGHWMGENWNFGDIANGGEYDINWQDLKNLAISRNEDWVVEILSMFVEEYGDQTYTVVVEW